MIRVQGLQLSSVAFMSRMRVALVYEQLGAFTFGGMASSSLTSVAKMTTGHLQPHFLAVRLPDPASFNCESSDITNYTCTGHPEDAPGVSRCYPPVPQLYVQAGSWGQKTRLLRPTIQLLFLFLALFTGYLRILDYWHHPSDTVFGFVQGALMAFWVVGDAKGCLGTRESLHAWEPWVHLALFTCQ
ncbi:hypothetical protein HPG69_008200, partial [Diceros bicornis minor]